MRKLLIFLMIAIPLFVILIVNITVDAVGGIVIIPVDNLTLSCEEFDDDDLSQITINDKSKTLKLKADVYPKSASNKTVYWESTDENVATVDSFGNVTFVGFGSVSVYAISSDGTKRSSCSILVTDTRVNDIVVYADDLKLEIGEKTNIWACVIPDTSINGKYTLTSSNPDILRIEASGEIDYKVEATALSAGEVTITATAVDDSIGYKATKSITINVVKSVEYVKLYPEENFTSIKNKVNLSCSVFPVDASDRSVTYSIREEDYEIASISINGIVTFSKAGTIVATVTTNDGDFSDTVNLTYTGGYPLNFGPNIYIRDLDNLSSEPKLLTEILNQLIEVNVSNGLASRQVLYTLLPTGTQPDVQNVVFHSTNTDVAVVDQNGKIEILAGGEATIFVSVQTGEDSYEGFSIGIKSIRKIDSISFDSNSVVTALPEYEIIPICIPFDSTETDSLSFTIISGQGLATISNSGVVTFTSAGEIVVLVSDQSPLQTETISSTITIKYTDGYPNSISDEETNIVINAGEDPYYLNFLEDLQPAIGISKIDYYYEITSQSPVYGSDQVVTIESSTNRITGVSGGTAVVTLYIKISEFNWISKSYNITVNQDISNIELICNEELYEDSYISALNTFNFSTNIYPADATNKEIIFELSNTNIARFLNNNQIHFNEPGVIVLKVYSVKNPNIKSSITLWYTGNCAISASIKTSFADQTYISGLPDSVIYGDDPFTVSLENIIPANATNQSFKITSLSSSKKFISVSYNSDNTTAVATILNSGNTTLSLLLSKPDGTHTILLTKDLTIQQKVSYLSFPKASQTTPNIQYTLNCEIYPQNATQDEIIYSLSEDYTAIARIEGSTLIFNDSQNETESVIVTATLTDIDGTIKTSQIEVTSTFGKTSTENDSFDLGLDKNITFNYSNRLTANNKINVLITTGSEHISYSLSDGILTISGQSVGYSEIKIQLLDGSDNLLEVLNEFKIDVKVVVENITINSSSFTQIGSKLVTAQNNIPLSINLTPSNANINDLIISVSDPSLATYNLTTGILNFSGPGTIILTISSSDSSCSRSFTIQYTSGLVLSYTLSLETITSFAINELYDISLISYLPLNANVTISDVSEVVLSGSSASAEISNSDGFKIKFNRSGTVRLKIILSDGSQKILSINVVTSLTEITFEKDSILTALENIALTPTLFPTSATDKSLIFTSSDTSIATVTSNGLVTFIKPGTVTITAQSATNANINDSCEITGTMGNVSDFTLNTLDLTLYVDQSKSLIVTSFSPLDVTNTNFIYTVISNSANDGSSDSVISINNSTITGLKGGTAIIEISITNQQGEKVYKLCNVTVLKDLNSISIDFNKTLDFYQNYYITSQNMLDIFVTLSPADATITSQSLTIDNTAIARIEDGKLIFIGEGIVQLTANYNNKSKTVLIRYTRSAISFEIDDNNSTVTNGVRNIYLYAGESYTVNIKNVIPSDLDASEVQLILNSNVPNYNNDNVCRIADNVITGINGGYAVYSVSIGSYGSPETIKVNVLRLATSIECPLNITTPDATYPLSAYVLPYDTSDKILTYSIKTGSEYASINTSGTLTFTSKGTVTVQIKNTASNLTKEVSVRYDPDAKQITLSSVENFVFIGRSLQLTARISPYDARNEEIIWATSDPNIATISSSGLLTPTLVNAKGTEGTITVTAKLKNFPETVATMEINVYAMVYDVTFMLSNYDDASCGIEGRRVFGMYSIVGSLTHIEGDLTSCLTNQFTMAMKYFAHNASTPAQLIWTSSNEAVATVVNGVLTILKAGTTTITCTPVKQVYTNDPSESNYKIASFTFTFVEGINIYNSESFTKWSAITTEMLEYKPLEELNSSGQHPTLPYSTIQKLQTSYYYAGLASVLHNDLVFANISKIIQKDIYGNGYKLDLQLKTIPNNESFKIKNSVTLTNVYFRGYSFVQGDSLTKVQKVSNVIEILYEEDHDLNVVLKNCIVDGGMVGIYLENATLTLSGCIIKNTYRGGITFSSQKKEAPGIMINLNNCILENSLWGTILCLAEEDKISVNPIVNLNGNIFMFNWQNLVQYKDFSIEGEFSALNSSLATEIEYALSNFKYRFIIIDNISYFHFGILVPSASIITKTINFNCDIIDNSTNIAYGYVEYSNTIALVGSYSIKSYGLNNSSTAILPLQSYMNDNRKTVSEYYALIRDLS